MSDEPKTDANVSHDVERRRVSVPEALALLPGAEGQRFAKVLGHGSLVVWVVFYGPEGGERP